MSDAMTDMRNKKKLREEIESLRQQLTDLKSELKTIGKAIDDPRTDLTMTMSEVIIEQKKQLAAALAAIKVKDGALRFYKSALTADDVVGVALAATADLDGLILCEKKPVARKISYGSLVFLEGYAELSEGTPLYRAWEPKT